MQLILVTYNMQLTYANYWLQSHFISNIQLLYIYIYIYICSTREEFRRCCRIYGYTGDVQQTIIYHSLTEILPYIYIYIERERQRERYSIHSIYILCTQKNIQYTLQYILYYNMSNDTYTIISITSIITIIVIIVIILVCMCVYIYIYIYVHIDP